MQSCLLTPFKCVNTEAIELYGIIFIALYGSLILSSPLSTLAIVYLSNLLQHSALTNQMSGPSGKQFCVASGLSKEDDVQQVSTLPPFLGCLLFPDCISLSYQFFSLSNVRFSSVWSLSDKAKSHIPTTSQSLIISFLISPC